MRPGSPTNPLQWSPTSTSLPTAASPCLAMPTLRVGWCMPCLALDGLDSAATTTPCKTVLLRASQPRQCSRLAPSTLRPPCCHSPPLTPSPAGIFAPENFTASYNWTMDGLMANAGGWPALPCRRVWCIRKDAGASRPLLPGIARRTHPKLFAHCPHLQASATCGQ